MERGAKVEVQVHVREDEPPRTTILRGDAIARLRPDLVVAAVYAPEQTLSTRPIDVVADIEELNDETGATATLTLMLGPTAVAEPKTVTVAAGATKPVTFEGVKLETAMTANLTVRVEGAAPFETDETNNARSRTVEVTEHELGARTCSSPASPATARSSTTTSTPRSRRGRRARPTTTSRRR